MVTLVEKVNHLGRFGDKDREFGSGVTRIKPLVQALASREGFLRYD